MEKELRQLKFKTNNTIGDDIEVIVKVKEKGGNVCYIQVTHKILEALESFTDFGRIQTLPIKKRTQGVRKR